VKGNAHNAQVLAAKVSRSDLSGGAPVLAIEKINTTQVGQFRNFFIGLPIVLNRQFSVGKVHEISEVSSLYDGMVASSDYGIYLKDSRARLWDQHESLTQAFYGAGYHIKETEGDVVAQGFFGQYIWSSGNDSSSDGELGRVINRLIKQTGLNEELFVLVPSVKKIGTANVSLRIHLAEDPTQRLIRRAQQKSQKKWADEVLGEAAQFLRSRENVKEFCGVQDETDCRRRLASSIHTAVGHMHKGLSDMSRSLAERNRKAFVEAYARFGKGMMANQFTLQSALSWAGEGVILDYRIEGTDVSAYRRVIETTSARGVFRNSSEVIATDNPVGRGQPTRERGMFIMPGKPYVMPPVQK
jgi:hypothetical protein